MKRQTLGQHYLQDVEVAREMVSLAKIGPDDRVLEIGTGRGALTRELLGRGAGFEGYEIDKDNFEVTSRIVRPAKGHLHLADAFRHRPRFDILVSSLPYSESTTFIQWLSGIGFLRAVVLLQQDFVEKITAPPGARNYRGISALAQLSLHVEARRRVGRDSFSPQPRVNSMVVVLSPKRLIPKAEARRIMLLFSLRRKRVDSALAKQGMEWKGGNGLKRVSSLTPEEVHQICGRERSRA